MSRGNTLLATALLCAFGCSDSVGESSATSHDASTDAESDTAHDDTAAPDTGSRDGELDGGIDGGDASDAHASDAPDDLAPGEAGPCGPIGVPRVFAVYAMNFGVESPPGTAPGFDIDGRVSAPTDDVGCNMPDFVGPDGRTGVDNQFARLIPPLVAALGESPDDSLVRAITEAELVLLFEVESLDDPENDQCVSVNIYRATHDVIFGTDGNLLAGQSFDIDLERPWARFEDAMVVDGRLVASGVRLELPLSFFSTNVNIILADFFMELDLIGEHTGVFGGAILLDDMISAVVEIDPGFVEIATNLLTSNADLWPDSDGDCTAISIAWEFAAHVGHLYPDVERPTAD